MKKMKKDFFAIIYDNDGLIKSSLLHEVLFILPKKSVSIKCNHRIDPHQ